MKKIELIEKLGMSKTSYWRMEREEPERLRGLIEMAGLEVPKNLLLGVSDTHLAKLEKENPEIVERMIAGHDEGVPEIDEKESAKRLKRFHASLEKSGMGHLKPIGWTTYKMVPTGIEKLDEMLGGGVARGHLFNIVGQSGTGKTTLAIMSGVGFQKTGRILYVDIEKTWDSSYAKRLGVDESQWDIFQPGDSSEALELMRKAAHDGSHRLIILDSIAQIPFKTELENETGKRNMERAIVMNSHLRIVLSYLLCNDVTAIYVNQLRESMTMYGEKYVQPGGSGILYAQTQGVYLKDKGKGTNAELQKKGERPVMFYFQKCRPNSESLYQTEEFLITKEDGFKKESL